MIELCKVFFFPLINTVKVLIPLSIKSLCSKTLHTCFNYFLIINTEEGARLDGRESLCCICVIDFQTCKGLVVNI